MTFKQFVNTLNEQDDSGFRISVEGTYEGFLPRSSFLLEYLFNLMVLDWYYDPSEECYYIDLGEENK